MNYTFYEFKDYILISSDRTLDENFANNALRTEHFEKHCFQSGETPSPYDLISKDITDLKFSGFKTARDYEAQANFLAESPCITVNTVDELKTVAATTKTGVIGFEQLFYDKKSKEWVNRWVKVKMSNITNVPKEYTDYKNFPNDIKSRNTWGLGIRALVAYSRENDADEPIIHTYYLTKVGYLGLGDDGVLNTFVGGLNDYETNPKPFSIKCEYFEYDREANEFFPIKKVKQFQVNEVDEAIQFFSNSYTYSIGVYKYKQEVFEGSARALINKYVKGLNNISMKNNHITKSDEKSCRDNCLNKEKMPSYIISQIKQTLTKHLNDYERLFTNIVSEDTKTLVNYLLKLNVFDKDVNYESLLDNLYLQYLTAKDEKKDNVSNMKNFVSYLSNVVKDSKILTEAKVDSKKLKNISQKVSNLLPTQDTPCKRGYIAPDGKFVVTSQFNDDHQRMKNKLKDTYSLSDEDSQIEDLGYIRFNLNGEGFVALSKIEPTEQQYNSLALLLDTYLKTGCWRYNVFMLIEPYSVEDKKDSMIPKSLFHKFEVYGSDAYISDDYIKIIRNYYRTGEIRE